MFSQPDAYQEQLLNENQIKEPIHCHMEHSLPDKRIARPHFHDAIELLYSFSGSTRVFVSGQSHKMEPGDLIIINSNEVHAIYAEAGTDVEYLVIKLDPEVLYSTSRSIFESRYVLPFTLAKSSPQTLLTKNEMSRTTIPITIEKIMEEFSAKDYGFDFAIRIHICTIFLAVLRHWRETGVPIGIMDAINDADFQLMRHVFKLLETEYPSLLTAKEAAKSCNLSYSYFSRKIKSITGRSFTELLNYVRITEAEKLLTTTNATITDVAISVGYSSTSYFIQQFKQAKHISPLRFKKQLQRTGLSENQTFLS
ncbi:AraC family transcriptional regulator [Bacillus sp. JCM 19041]|uniref:helix-turn-helix domain-containing protein n=1 Tax=Bacillus sp. JCM 19041 TaxID=1460637 RepID=UPI0006CF3E62